MFAVAFAHLGEIFDKPATPARMEAYAAALEDIPTGPLLLAMKAATTQCTFFPKPVELRQLAGERTPEDRASRAWEYVVGAVAKIGVYKSPDFGDPLTNATIATLGGWVYICDLPSEEFSKWLRKDFIKTYQGKMRTGLAENEGGHLCGLHAVGNEHAGFDVAGNPMIGGAVPVLMDLPQLAHVGKPLPKELTKGDGTPLLTLKKA